MLPAFITTLNVQGVVIALKDFNGHLGNSLDDKGKHAPNSRGLKLLDLNSDVQSNFEKYVKRSTGLILAHL